MLAACPCLHFLPTTDCRTSTCICLLLSSRYQTALAEVYGYLPVAKSRGHTASLIFLALCDFPYLVPVLTTVLHFPKFPFLAAAAQHSWNSFSSHVWAKCVSPSGHCHLWHLSLRSPIVPPASLSLHHSGSPQPRPPLHLGLLTGSLMSRLTFRQSRLCISPETAFQKQPHFC